MRTKVKRKIKPLVIYFGLSILGSAILLTISLKSQVNKLSKTDKGKIEDMSADRTNLLVDDFPVYKNAVLITDAKSDNGKGRSFIWQTDDESLLVFEYLKSELRIKGFTLSNESSAGSSSAVSFEKNNVQGFLGVFEGSGANTVISVTIKIS